MMKMIYRLTVAIILFSQFNISAQQTQQGFIIHKGEGDLLLVDVNDSVYCDKPTDRKGRPYAEFIFKNPMDPDIQKGLEVSIFTDEVISRHLLTGTPSAYCKVDTAGNIVSVSFSLSTPDIADGELAMFAAYREQLKNDVTYKVSFPRGIATAGYLTANFMMFSYNIQSQQDLYGLNYNCYEVLIDQGYPLIYCEYYDSKYHLYTNLPAKDESGNVLDGALTFQFSKQGQLERIEKALLTHEQYLTAFHPKVIFAVNANSGEVMAMNIHFIQVADTSMIDLIRLEQFMEQVKNELLYEQIIYDGKKAASGYLIHELRLFSPERKSDYSIPNLKDCPIIKRNFLIRE